MKRSIMQTYMLLLTILIVASIGNVYASVTPQTMVLKDFPETFVIEKHVCGDAQVKKISIDSYNEIGLKGPGYVPGLCTADQIFQITSSEGKEAHPSLVIDADDNPFMLYDYSDFPHILDSDIYIQQSFDQGKTWNNEHIWVWENADTYDFNPDCSMMADGYRAFGTHEVDVLEPTMYLHDYVDVTIPDSWVMYFFDLSPEVSYVKDTAIATYGVNTIALSGVVDFSYHEYNLDDTVVIFWNSESGMDTWPGLYIINTDNDGNSRPLSHISSDAGDKIFVVYQMNPHGEESEIYVAYCPSTEILFEKWRILKVSRSSGNVINPSVSASGKYAYIVCQDDEKGSQDVVCYTTTSGHYWKKSIIANSFADEINPVITAEGERASCLFIRNGNIYESKTENAGVNWSEPVQINDVDGTVVDGYRSIDSAGMFGVWADTREGNQDLYIAEVGPAPFLEFDTISFSYKIKATITNTGTAPEDNVRWSIEVDGFAIPESKSGRINRIDIGETEAIQTDFFFGFGPISVTITVGHLVIGVNGIGVGPMLYPIHDP